MIVSLRKTYKSLQKKTCRCRPATASHSMPTSSIPTLPGASQSKKRCALWLALQDPVGPAVRTASLLEQGDSNCRSALAVLVLGIRPN
jgi:hypothetical protein